MEENIKYSESIMATLRERRGLDEDDTTEDKAINEYSSDQAFREVMGWEFGSTSWAGTVKGWVEDIYNVDLSEKENK